MSNRFPMGRSIAETPMFGLGATAKEEETARLIAEQNRRVAADTAAAMQTPEMLAWAKEMARRSGVSKAASLIAGQSASSPYYPPSSDGLPGWVLPVGLGVGALVLVLALKGRS